MRIHAMPNVICFAAKAMLNLLNKICMKKIVILILIFVTFIATSNAKSSLCICKNQNRKNFDGLEEGSSGQARARTVCAHFCGKNEKNIESVGPLRN